MTPDKKLGCNWIQADIHRNALNPGGMMLEQEYNAHPLSPSSGKFFSFLFCLIPFCSPTPAAYNGYVLGSPQDLG